MTQWKPIETAPRDGTMVDLWVEYSNFAGRSAGCRYEHTKWVSRSGNNEEQILDGQGKKTYGRGIATYWMEVPLAPPIPKQEYEDLIESLETIHAFKDFAQMRDRLSRLLEIRVPEDWENNYNFAFSLIPKNASYRSNSSVGGYVFILTIDGISYKSVGLTLSLAIYLAVLKYLAAVSENA